MYSILMVMALNAGTAVTPAWDGCGGCYSSCGGYVACSGGCWGSCSGCHGGHRLFGKRHGGHGCNGCWSGCSGGHGCMSACSGCNGGGHRLFGGLFNKNRCHGCNGCYSGCSGCHGCHMSACHGCHGCSGCMGTPAAPMQQAPPPAKKEGTVKPTSAELTVSLPAEAKLFIDGQATTTTSSSRKFVSPELEQGKEYFYTLRAEIVRDGKTVSLTKEVTVRAGDTFQTSFEFSDSPVAAK